MSARPFLFFISLDDDGRHVLRVQGDGIPLTERRLTIDDCLRHAKAFTEAAMAIVEAERREKRNGA